MIAQRTTDDTRPSSWHTTDDKRAAFAADAGGAIPIDVLCNVLLSKWPRPVSESGSDAFDPADTTFLQYTYDSTVFQAPDPFFGAQLQGIPLPEYVARMVQFMSTAPFPCAVMALRLIDKYCRSTMEAVGYNNAHLLIGTAMMVASKALCDEHMSWEYYCRVIGAPSALLVNLEVIMLFESRWDILPSLEEYGAYRALLTVAPPLQQQQQQHAEAAPRTQVFAVPKEGMGVSVTSSSYSGGATDSEPSTVITHDAPSALPHDETS